MAWTSTLLYSFELLLSSFSSFLAFGLLFLSFDFFIWSISTGGGFTSFYYFSTAALGCCYSNSYSSYSAGCCCFYSANCCYFCFCYCCCCSLVGLGLSNTRSWGFSLAYVTSVPYKASESRLAGLCLEGSLFFSSGSGSKCSLSPNSFSHSFEKYFLSL